MAQPVASFAGLASGIQWRDMIDQIMQLERAPIMRLQSRVSRTAAEVTAWKAFKANVKAVSDAATGLANGSALERFTTTVRGTPQNEAPSVSVTAGDGAHIGTVRVRTVAVARAQKLGGDAFAARDSVPGVAGELQVNGRSVVISETDTLEQIAASINAANIGADPAGVSASVLKTPTGEYRLLLTSSTTGAAGMMLGDDGSGALAALGLDSPEVITAGTDAQIEIDGALYTGSSNTFDDILQGVTFTALRESASEVEVDVTRDTTATVAAARKFVDAMNGIASFVKGQTGSAALANNGTLRTMGNTLRDPMLASVDLGGDVSARLSDIGIEVDRYGVYSLDADRLTEMLGTDPGLVGGLLGGSDGIAAQVGTIADRLLSVGDGSIDGAVAQLEGRLPAFDARIADLETRLEQREAALIRRFTVMEQAMAQAQSQSDWLASQISAFEKK